MRKFRQFELSKVGDSDGSRHVWLDLREVIAFNDTYSEGLTEVHLHRGSFVIEMRPGAFMNLLREVV